MSMMAAVSSWRPWRTFSEEFQGQAEARKRDSRRPVQHTTVRVIPLAAVYRVGVIPAPGKMHVAQEMCSGLRG